MNTSITRGASIPRLQEISFLEVAAQCVSKGATFDEVRQALIGHMIGLREASVSTGNTAISRQAKPIPQHYFSNAAEALSELMRLGMIEKATVPGTSSAVAAYQNRRFTMTIAGESWIAQLNLSKQTAYDTLLTNLWQHHPQFAGYLRLLAKNMLVIPTAKWTEMGRLPPNANERSSFLAFLSRRAAQEATTGSLGWEATEDEIVAGMQSYIDNRLESAVRRSRPNPYPRHRDFVGACEEALVSFAFNKAGLPLDYISHEILRRWTKDLGVANFSYHVPTSPALRLWITADFDEVDGSPFFGRRVKNWGNRIIDTLPEAYSEVRRKEGNNAWVPIYRVRAVVCCKLGLNDPVFDAALKDFLEHKLCLDASFRLHFDPNEYGMTPPTEQPLKLIDRTGRISNFHVMTLIPS
jgi:hypothetical protein